MERYMSRQRLLRIVLVSAAAGLLAACGSQESVPPAAGEPIRGVRFEKVRMMEWPAVYEATGTVRSVTTSVVAAQISGTVLETRVKAGEHVRQGQILAVIDDRTPRAQLAAADAGMVEAAQGVAEIEQGIAAAAADRQFAEATYKRYQGLLEKNSVSKQEFEGAESRYKAALAGERALEARRKQIEARGRQAESHKESAQAVFSYSRVVAPINGVITAKSVDAGTVVMPGTPLFTVEDPRRYRFEASVPEQFISSLSLGTSVSVALNGEKLGGVVNEIVPAADSTTRTFLMKVDLPPDCGCRSGEYGTAGFKVGQVKGIILPRFAVVSHGQLEGVFVANSRNTLEFRLVKTGKPVGDGVEIISGLTEGESVAVSKVDELRDGARVEGQ